MDHITERAYAAALAAEVEAREEEIRARPVKLRPEGSTVRDVRTVLVVEMRGRCSMDHLVHRTSLPGEVIAAALRIIGATVEKVPRSQAAIVVLDLRRRRPPRSPPGGSRNGAR